VPTFEHAMQPAAAVGADVLVVFATGSAADADDPVAQLTPSAASTAVELGIDVAGELRAVGFDGGLGDVAHIPTRGAATAALLVVVGLGEAERVDAEVLRRAAGAAARAATKDAVVAVVAPLELVGSADGDSALPGVQALVEGLALGAYGYTEYRRKPHDVPSIARVLVLADADGKVEEAIARGKALSDATALARDLVNTPPMSKRPPMLADRIAAVARSVGLGVEVWDAKALEKGRFGGILGVGQGSSVEPRMVELTYEPKGFGGARFGKAKGGHVVLVGKGITFDSGGLSLKPSASMTTMKSDMGGAAAIVGAMSVLGALGVGTKVTGLLALAENMPGGDAIRVSDVLTHRDGTTVEVMNTDAEGRLVLADALAYGAEQAPDAMIDLATLTGAQVVALGPDISGLMGTDDALVEALEAAAKTAGEKLWHLPLPVEYREQLRSEVADLKNIGKPGQAGTLVAGLFLKEFVGDVPWAHLDIAGPAFTEEGDAFYRAKGGTGVMVRTLVQYLRDRA